MSERVRFPPRGAFDPGKLLKRRRDGRMPGTEVFFLSVDHAQHRPHGGVSIARGREIPRRLNPNVRNVRVGNTQRS